MVDVDEDRETTEGRKPLSPEAERALAEADARRKAGVNGGGTPRAEVGGRSGPDPVRFGDWEKGGIASDF